MKNKTALNTIALLLVVMMLQVSTFAGDLEVDGSLKLTDSTTDEVELKKASSTKELMLLTTTHGYLEIGPDNTSWCHFVTDRGRF